MNQLFRRNTLSLCFIIIVKVFVYGQCIDDAKLKCWSGIDHLALEDFKIVSIDESYEPISGQFGISYDIKSFDRFKKNFNKHVNNVFFKRASELDTTRVKDLKSNLDFLQLQFDLCEIHVRKFRKELFLNRKELLKGLDFVGLLQEETIANFANEKRKLIRETDNGRDEEKLNEWSMKIEQELEALIQFSAWNSKKIKI